MRAILIKDSKGPISNLYLDDTPKPSLKSGEVCVKVKAFGLNRMDIYQREGRYPLPPGASPILGVEFAGIVDEVGSAPDGEEEEQKLLREAIGRWKVGDEVFGLAYGGAYAEYINSPATHLIHKPKHLSFAEAAGVPEAWLTAFQALFLNSQLKKGDNVLVHAAASGVGLAAIQLARLYGANIVAGTASTKDKLDFITSMPNGATAGFNYKEQDFSAEMKKITDGHGTDVLIDFVGQSHWQRNIDSLAPDGQMVMLGLMGGTKIPDGFDLTPILYKRLRIQGSTLRARSIVYQAKLIKRFEDEVVDKLSGSNGNGEVRLYIHKVYPWDQIQEAHTELESHNNTGKIICEIA
jgi:putative PIG3 family NAD(P)H quinone oxidoreductase